jgi:hypothetical protein
MQYGNNNLYELIDYILPYIDQIVQGPEIKNTLAC